MVYQFRFHTKIRNKKTFLYNTGRINSLGDAQWNRPQFYSVTRVKNGRKTVLGRDLRCPPVNVGPRSTPDYENKLGSPARHRLGLRTVYAGQRAEGFHVDLGAIFDLGTLRPFSQAHLVPSAEAMDGVDSTKTYNVHSIAIEVPISEVTRNGNKPTDPAAPGAVIVVWATASRRKSRILNAKTGKTEGHGPWQQVSRLGSPLLNEVIVPMAEKDKWNVDSPAGDKAYARYVNRPGWPRCCRCSTPVCSRTSRSTPGRVRT